jgi:hypothetical protein
MEESELASFHFRCVSSAIEWVMQTGGYDVLMSFQEGCMMPLAADDEDWDPLAELPLVYQHTASHLLKDHFLTVQSDDAGKPQSTSFWSRRAITWIPAWLSIFSSSATQGCGFTKW